MTEIATTRHSGGREASSAQAIHSVSRCKAQFHFSQAFQWRADSKSSGGKRISARPGPGKDDAQKSQKVPKWLSRMQETPHKSNISPSGTMPLWGTTG
ncbi:hypothetical protein VTG60DRAFT_3290 [Thermothelomyces hinnuleus]